MRRSREADAFLRLVAPGNDEPVRRASDSVKYDMPRDLPYEKARADDMAWHHISTILHHFEMIGVLVEHGHVPASIVYDQMGGWIGGSWAKLERIVGSHRTAGHVPVYAENVELLARGFERWARKHSAKLEKRPRVGPEAIQGYYE